MFSIFFTILPYSWSLPSDPITQYFDKLVYEDKISFISSEIQSANSLYWFDYLTSHYNELKDYENNYLIQLIISDTVFFNTSEPHIADIMLDNKLYLWSGICTSYLESSLKTEKANRKLINNIGEKLFTQITEKEGYPVQDNHREIYIYVELTTKLYPQNFYRSKILGSIRDKALLKSLSIFY